MESKPEKSDEIRLEKMTADECKLFVRINRRDVMLEKAGEGAAARYILTWGLEGQRQKSGREGFIAILDTRLAVEQLLNYKPPEYKAKKRKAPEPASLMFDESGRADSFRQVIKVLIKEILRLEDRKLLARYKRIS